MSQPIITNISSNSNSSVLILEVTGGKSTTSPDNVVTGYTLRNGDSASGISLPVYGRFDYAMRMVQVYVNGERNVIWYHPGPAPGNPGELGYSIYIGADSRTPAWNGPAGSSKFKLNVTDQNTITISPD